MKKVLALVLAADFSAAMVTDTGGVNDRSFNQNVWEGLQLAQQELGIEVGYLQSTQEADYAPNLENLLDKDTSLIIGVGFLLADATLAAAEANPDTKYVGVDNYYENPPANLVGMTFAEEQPGFLAGYVAGKMTKTNKIGFLGGMAVPAVVAYEWGYVAGAKTANPDIVVVQQYAESFNDVAKGKAIATQMFNDNADIVFCCGGTMGVGGIEAAKEMGKWAIGVDVDQNHLAPDNVLTSAMKFLDVATLELCKEAQEGTFVGGNKVGNLANGMVGIPAESTAKHVPQEILDELKEIEAKIVAGEIQIPRDAEQAKAMGYAE